MSNYINGTGLTYLLNKIKTAFILKTDTTAVTSVNIDSTPTTNSTNLVTSGGVYNTLQGKEDKMDIVTASGTTLSALMGKYYTLSNVGTFAITLPAIASGTTKVLTVVFYISAGSSPAVTFTSTHSIYYAAGFEIAANSTYEVNALWNGSAWIITSVTIIVE